MRPLPRALFVAACALLGVSCADGHAGNERACAVWSGPGFEDERVCYEIIDGMAISGDIILGTHAELQSRMAELERGDGFRNAIAGRKYFWSNARVPYTIADDVPLDLKLKIANSARDYNDHTKLRWVPRANGDSDYVEFVMAAADADFGGRSYLGHQGGRQIIELTQGLVGRAHAHHTIRHEMGHAVGLVHEQARPDRDDHITINWANIAKNWRDQYEVRKGNRNVLSYDFASIMHYALDANGDGKQEMTPKAALANPGSVGAGLALSAGDIADIDYLYNVWVVPWESLGNTSLVDLQVRANEDGRLEVFARRSDGSLWHRWQLEPRAGWSEWESLGNGNALVTVGRNGDGRLEVFALAGDQLWHKWQVKANGTWSDWAAIGGALGGIGQLVAATNKDGRLEVFARRSNGEIDHIWQQKNGVGGWSDWAQLCSPGASDIAVIENSDGRIEVAWVGTGGSVGHQWQNIAWPSGNVSWSDPSAFDHAPSGAASDIELTRNKDGHLEAFVTLASGGIESSWFGRGWSPWSSFSSDSGQNVSAYNHDGRLEVFKLVGGHVHHRWQSANSGGTWSDWQQLPGSPGDVTRIAVARNADQGLFDEAYLELFAIRNAGGGTLYHTWQKGLGLPGNGEPGLGGSCSVLTDDTCQIGSTGNDEDATGDAPSSAEDSGGEVTGAWTSTGTGTTETSSSSTTSGSSTTGDGTTGDDDATWTGPSVPDLGDDDDDAGSLSSTGWHPDLGTAEVDVDHLD